MLFAWAAMVSEPAVAADCKKGIRCGNSCIAANRTCHIDTPPVQPEKKTQAKPAVVEQQIPAVQSNVEPASAQSSSTPAAAVPVPPVAAELSSANTLWVASEPDRLYYLPGCTDAERVSALNRRFFPDELSAQRAGFRRSTAPGC